eukprot:s768_g21.t1
MARAKLRTSWPLNFQLGKGEHRSQSSDLPMLEQRFALVLQCSSLSGLQQRIYAYAVSGLFHGLVKCKAKHKLGEENGLQAGFNGEESNYCGK